MPPKELTRHQISSRLAYSQGTPAFLQRLKNQVSGVPSGSNDEGEDEFDTWQASSGRPPIPKRPTPPSRPEGDPGSDQEDADDERPQVVVLKEGKHLTADEAENERRRALGLPPLQKESEENTGKADDEDNENPKKRKDATPSSTQPKSSSLSFASSSSSRTGPSNSKKRKLPDALQTLASKDPSQSKTGSKHSSGKDKNKESGSKKKKAKKAGTLLSFGDGND